MKVLNTNFNVEVGDFVEFHPDAVEWINKNTTANWPSISELKKFGLMEVIGKEWEPKKKEWFILYVSCQNSHTGLSSVIHGPGIDIWCLKRNGRILDNCPYPLFKVFQLVYKGVFPI